MSKPGPLPLFQPITIDQIQPASALLFYGGPRLTEWAGNILYKHPYRPPAFHAAFYIWNGLFLNVGKFRTVQELSNEFRSTRRIDVLTYVVQEEVRRSLCRSAFLDSSRPKVGLSFPDYSWTDFLRFGLRSLKPSKKQFCSENVVNIFKQGAVTVSDREPVDTAPWDILEYALANPLDVQCYTAWIGNDFKK